MVWGIGISILLLISASHPCHDFVLYWANRVLFLGLQVNGRHTVNRWELGQLWSYVFNKLLLNCFHVPVVVFFLRTICEEDYFQDDRNVLHFLMPGSWDWKINIFFSSPIYDILFCGVIFWPHVTLHFLWINLLKPRQLLPGGSDSKASACSVGDLGSIPGLERSAGEGNGNPLQYSCLENSMDRAAG